MHVLAQAVLSKGPCSSFDTVSDDVQHHSNKHECKKGNHQVATRWHRSQAAAAPCAGGWGRDLV